MKEMFRKCFVAVLISMITSVALADTREYVDLGLPSGTLWATCNIGADSPEDYGLYFAWGETTGYSEDTSDGRSFDWSTYKYCNGSSYTLTKYCNDSSRGYNGFTDNLTELVPEDDAATANWGAGWCMPTVEQFDELFNSSYTTTIWTTRNGKYGRLITSKMSGYTDRSIFIPAAGYRGDLSFLDSGSYGYCWSRTLYTSYPYYARSLSFNSSSIYPLSYYYRYYGRSVRPVCVSLTLSSSSLSLMRGGYAQLTATVSPATAPALTWSSSNTDVAVVGSNGVVVAAAAGTCTITCEITGCSDVLATCEVTVIPADVEEYVDLGLPSGTLWATCNVGANSPEDYGLYFAWGETTGYTGDNNDGHSFDWVSYKYNNGDNCALTKYCSNGSYGYNGFTDDLTELVSEDDAATANWGSEWCMPTIEQFQELTNSDYTTTEWTTVNGVYGRKITSKVSGHVGNFIFLPAAGFRLDSSLDGTGSGGLYWSRTLDAISPDNAFDLFFNSSRFSITSGYYGRCYGRSVRPVRVSLTLSSSSLSLMKGSYAQLTATVSPATTALTWRSSDTDVAMVSSNGMVVAVSTGTCTITCETTDGSNVSATCEVTVIPAGEKEYVDLGLPSGTLWATCNIGADNPEDYGLYFAWGETTGYTGDASDGRSFDGSTYKYCNGSSSTLTKYCNDSRFGNNGFTDDLTELVPEDDAATANWGSGWRMPSYDQFSELINSEYTTTEWTTVNDVYGRKITSKVAGHVGNYIFLPAAGVCDDSSLIDAGSGGYWSRTLSTIDPYGACGLWFNLSFINMDGYGSRFGGRPVRPVRVSNCTALRDGEVYDQIDDADYDEIAYTRTFNNKNWQALYVPFEMQYEDWKDNFVLARINDTHQFDDNDDGVIDRTELEVVKLRSGQTEAHTPYLIRAKKTGEQTITVTNATLYGAEEKSYDVSSWNTLYTFTGTYTGVPGETMFGNGYYAFGGGSLHQAADATNALSPMRWYMEVTDRYGNPKELGEVKVVVFDMEDLIETGLEEVAPDNIPTKEQAVYDLSGRRVTNPGHGIYVKNGRKVIIK